MWRSRSGLTPRGFDAWGRSRVSFSSRTHVMTLLSIRSLGIAAALFVGAGLAAGPVSAQQGSVAGQVTDKSNQQPVAGAAVLIAGTSLQARTGRDGRYSITNVPPGK